MSRERCKRPLWQLVTVWVMRVTSDASLRLPSLDIALALVELSRANSDQLLRPGGMLAVIRNTTPLVYIAR